MPSPVGTQLRQWRLRRKLSQLDLSVNADVSQRHLSFVETGKAAPSREMVLRLAHRLDVPLRERNLLLTSAGFAPMYSALPLDDPAMAAARSVVQRVLQGHEPCPALAVDRHWNIQMQNRAVGLLVAGASPALLKPPVNALRLSLHPEGLAPRIVNLAQWSAHVIARLRQQIDLSGDAELRRLEEELRSYPCHARQDQDPSHETSIVAPFILQTALGTLSFISTTTVFGTPIDITLSELAMETFFPADPFTADALRQALGRPEDEGEGSSVQ